jgi:Predicted membrane protein (DUF2142).
MTYRLPAWLVVINFIFLFILGLTEKEVRLDRRVAVSSSVAYTLIIIMTAVTMYMSWTLNHLDIAGALISLGNQGRYYTPFLIILVPIILFLKKYIKVEVDETLKRRIFKTVVTFNLVYFIILTLLFYYLADRGANFLPDVIIWVKTLV